MENNIIKTKSGTIIMNGGNPINGCPKDWNEANKIQEKLNLNKKGHGEPKWKFDCGFKLDYDGPLMRISSRFYPPKTHYGATWDGTVSVCILNKEIEEKKFDCSTLEELEKQVNEYVDGLKNKLNNAFK